jgi:hypothetical protein
MPNLSRDVNSDQQAIMSSRFQMRTRAEPVLYSAEEAADLPGIGRTLMFLLIRTGQIQSFKIGKRRKITSDAIRDHISRSPWGKPGSRSRGCGYSQPRIDEMFALHVYSRQTSSPDSTSLSTLSGR